MHYKVYGPYKGSAKNHGRPIYVLERPDGTKTSIDKARLDYIKKTGKALPKDVHVDHIDNDRTNDDPSNLRAMDAGANIAKGNRNR